MLGEFYEALDSVFSHVKSGAGTEGERERDLDQFPAIATAGLPMDFDAALDPLEHQRSVVCPPPDLQLPAGVSEGTIFHGIGR